MILKERDHDGSIAPRDLTRRQAEIVRLIVKLIQENHNYPTVRELMSLLGIRSPNGVMCTLLALQKKGWITGFTYRDRLSVQKARPMRLVGLRMVIAYDDSMQAERLRELIEG